VNNWQAIIFDLDDTLYPEREYVLSGFAAVAEWAEEQFGLTRDESFATLRRLYEDGVRGRTFNLWLQAQGLEEARWVPELVRVYREHTPHIALFPGIILLLNQLHSVCRLGLLTDGYLAVQRRKVASLNIAECFQAIVYSDEFGREAWKPSPIPFLAVTDRLGVAPEATVYVADNPAKDFIGARELGMHTLWARYSQGDYTLLQPPTAQYAADSEVDTIDQLRTLLIPH